MDAVLGEEADDLGSVHRWVEAGLVWSTECRRIM
jgi:hypothetical protein